GYAKLSNGSWYGSYDSVRAEEGPTCNEQPGLLARIFARLRAIFSRTHSDSCCDGVAGCTGGRGSVCNTCGAGEPHGLGLRDRLARFFHRPSEEVVCCAPEQTMIVQMMPPQAVLPPVQPATPMPAAPPMPALPIQRVSTNPTPLTPPAPTQISKEYLHRVANADDYSWVTGQLFYIHVHSDQGLWLVRYAPVDKEDRYGGSVVLAPAASMANFREGDLVTVYGEILNQGRASRYLGGPLYRALAVELKE